MSDRADPLLERLSRSLGLGDDAASAEILRRLRATAARLNYLPKSVAPAPAPPAIVVRGVLVTEPRYFERLRRRNRIPLLALAARALVWCFSVCSALATIFVFILMLLFLRYLTQAPPEEDLTFLAGLGGETAGVQVAQEKGKDKEKLEVKADKGPDKKDDATPEPPAKETAEKPPEKPPEASEKPPELEVKKSVVADAATLTDDEILDLITKQQNSIGVGETAPAPRPTARDLGRAIKEDPTKAIAHARAQTLAALRKGKEKRIVVVSGEYDECERLLDALRVPHACVSPERFLAYALDDTAVVILNCDRRYSRSNLDGIEEEDKAWQVLEQLRESRQKILEAIGKLDPADETQRKTLQKRLDATDADIEKTRKKIGGRTAGPTARKVREFVKSGGFLMTTDWALTVTEAAFPGYLYYAARYGPERTTILAENKNKDHALLKDALLDEMNGTRVTGGKTISWYVDSGSYLYDFDEEKVTLLVRGTALPTYKALVATFKPFGGTKEQEGGRVLHVAGHFKSQGDAYGDYVLQSLFLNFLAESIAKDR